MRTALFDKSLALLALLGLLGCSAEDSKKDDQNNNAARDMGLATNGGTNNGAWNPMLNGGTNNSTATSDMGNTRPPDLGPQNPLSDWCTGQPDDFSFFVTSMDALWVLSGSDPGDLNAGFGGDFGGIAGADQVCQTIGEATGSTKTWRAFLSVTDDGSGSAVNAIDRVGAGPWYDANGRLVANDVAGLTAGNRPDGDLQSTMDLPDECGVPLSVLGDAHDVLTGSTKQGTLTSDDPNTTCNDWTSSDAAVGGGGRMGTVMIGHSFPRENGSGQNWISDHPVRGCGKGANLIQDGPGTGNCVGCNGGFGAIYCFAL